MPLFNKMGVKTRNTKEANENESVSVTLYVYKVYKG